MKIRVRHTRTGETIAHLDRTSFAEAVKAEWLPKPTWQERDKLKTILHKHDIAVLPRRVWISPSLALHVAPENGEENANGPIPGTERY